MEETGKIWRDRSVRPLTNIYTFSLFLVFEFPCKMWAMTKSRVHKTKNFFSSWIKFILSSFSLLPAIVKIQRSIDHHWCKSMTSTHSWPVPLELPSSSQVLIYFDTVDYATIKLRCKSIPRSHQHAPINELAKLDNIGKLESYRALFLF